MSSNQEGAPRRAWVGKGKNVASRRWGVREKGSEQAQGFGGQEALVHLSHSRRSETNTFPEPRPSTAIFQAPRRALTGRHQLQEECLLCVVPLPQLPHDVAFPAGGRGPGTAGSSHRLSLPPAPSAPGPKQELAGRGGASRGLPDVRGRGAGRAAVGNPRVVPRAYLGENRTRPSREAAPGSTSQGALQRILT